MTAREMQSARSKELAAAIATLKRADRAPQREYHRRWRAARKKKGIGERECVGPPDEPCIVCGAPDSRAPDHARGCPELPAVSKQEMLRIAQNCERGWAELHQKARTAGA